MGWLKKRREQKAQYKEDKLFHAVKCLYCDTVMKTVVAFAKATPSADDLGLGKDVCWPYCPNCHSTNSYGVWGKMDSSCRPIVRQSDSKVYAAYKTLKASHYRIFSLGFTLDGINQTGSLFYRKTLPGGRQYISTSF